jgi:hypothetical protein
LEWVKNWRCWWCSLHFLYLRICLFHILFFVSADRFNFYHFYSLYCVFLFILFL